MFSSPRSFAFPKHTRCTLKSVLVLNNLLDKDMPGRFCVVKMSPWKTACVQRSLRKQCKSTQDHSMFSVFYPAPLIRAVYKPFFARSSSSSLSHFTSQKPKQSPMDSMSGWLLLFPKYWNGAKNVLVCSLFCPFSGLKIRHCHGMRRFASCLQKERRRAWPLEKEKDETK
jgi:hypothetical protein